MKEKRYIGIVCNRCPIGHHVGCTGLFWETYGYSCVAVPIVIEWPDGLDLKPQPKH